MEFHLAPEINRQIKLICQKIPLGHIKPSKIICFKSIGSRSNARARIWAFPRIWQLALNLKPHYCIEVLSENFNHLSDNEQTKVLIHELMHIPKNFSGALLPHRGRGKVVINNKTVNQLFKQLNKKSK